MSKQQYPLAEKPKQRRMENNTRIILLSIVIFMLSRICPGQETFRDGLIIIESKYAPFPHPDRLQGHSYHDSLYAFEKHYNDSSIALFIPAGFNPSPEVDLVFYFHGWWNNIQQSMDEFELLQQFSASRVNAIFVFPQGPKNAPDSFGGKMEAKGIFKKLVDDILYKLRALKIIDHMTVGRIILSGHSGAYRAIANILNRGGLTEPIKEVYLFDALYGQFEKYTHWLDHTDGKLINIITANGGTFENSLEFLKNLDDWRLPYLRLSGNQVDRQQLIENRIIFIFSDLEHNEVINPYLKLFLEASRLGKI